MAKSDSTPCVNHNRWQLDCIDCNPHPNAEAPKVEEYAAIMAEITEEILRDLPPEEREARIKAFEEACNELSQEAPKAPDTKASDEIRASGEGEAQIAEREDREAAPTSMKPAPAPEPKQGSGEPILPVTELEAEKSTSKILRNLLVKAEAERDEARATKDMHKERQEEAWAEVAALRAELAAAKERVEELESMLLRNSCLARVCECGTSSELCGEANDIRANRKKEESK